MKKCDGTGFIGFRIKKRGGMVFAGGRFRFLLWP